MSRRVFLSRKKSFRDTETLTSQRRDEAEGVQLSLRIFASHTFLLSFHTGIRNSLKPFLVLFEHPTAQQQPIPIIKDVDHVSSIAKKHARDINNAEPLVRRNGLLSDGMIDASTFRQADGLCSGRPVAKARCQVKARTPLGCSVQPLTHPADVTLCIRLPISCFLTQSHLRMKAHPQRGSGCGRIATTCTTSG